MSVVRLGIVHKGWGVVIVAQGGLPENPFGYGVLGLIVVLWMTGWLYSRGSYVKETERADKWEAVAAKKDETIATQAETIREFTELGSLLRTVIENLPRDGATKPTRRTQRITP